MTARVWSRVIAAACAVIAVPLMLIVISWLPALVMSARDYYRALSTPGTPSFHQDMASHLKQSIITAGIFAGAATAWGGYIFIAIDPRAKRDQFMWMFACVVIAAHLSANAAALRGMNRDGMLLFGGIPLLVGLLSLAGLWVSRKAVQTGM